MASMVVVVTDEFTAWYNGLLDDGHGNQVEEVDFLVGLLEERGVTLGSPYSSALNGTDFAFRELRGTAGKAELRILYAFDPRRDAVLIVGGDKNGDKGFYKRMIAQAEKVWKQYLVEQGFKK